jgi:UDP-N-acetyl-D-mannosaminuronic acid dehydrogenase
VVTPHGSDNDAYVAVIGLGYVGLTLAVSMARAGIRVVGVETNPALRQALAQRRTMVYEPGVAELLHSLPAGQFTVTGALPAPGTDAATMAAAIICVGTPVDQRTRRPDLGHFESAVTHTVEHAGADTLVVVRSTVPVGTTRRIVYARMRERFDEPLLAFCPERTIQGRALAELTSLPQVIGGVDERSVGRARDLFASLTADHVTVSSLEIAEMVKLACNAHTDLVYGFGNEVAMIAHALGLDGNEVIAAANVRYPRPDLARPGFVGGSCLTKDPYLLIQAAEEAGYHPRMVAAARAVNEDVPRLVVDQVLDSLVATGCPPAEATVLVCGIAYKGRPETDDVRGSAAADVGALLGGRVGALRGHDYLVAPETITRLGFQPTALEAGLRDADALVLLVDHHRYRQELDAATIRTWMRKPAVVFDLWGELAADLTGLEDVEYRRLGHG